MVRALWTAASGMEAQQTTIDTIANNLANINTTAFKKSRVNFQDLMYQTTRTAGTTTSQGTRLPVGIQAGLGTKVTSVEKIFLQGDLTQTQNPLDLAIQGQGFFQLIYQGKQVYTRSGAFKTDNNGNVCDANGNPLQPAFTIPPNTVTITVESGGQLVAADSSGKQLASTQLQLFNFPNPAGLQSLGQNLFIASDGSGDPVQGNPGVDQFGTILQGYQEMSNVDVVEEMINMIMAQRSYEMGTKVIQASDQALQEANNLVQQ
jgi:flagellar basal-body rod protein FlgG